MEQRNKGYARPDQTTGLSSLVPCLWQWPILYASDKRKEKKKKTHLSANASQILKSDLLLHLNIAGARVAEV